MVRGYIYFAGRFFTNNIWRFRWCCGCSRRQRYLIILAIVFLLGCVLITVSPSSPIFTYPQATSIYPSCRNGRFESGEDALMPRIIGWVRQWMRFHTDTIVPEPSLDLMPCEHNSAKVCRAMNCSHPLESDVSDRIQNEMFNAKMMLTMQNIIRIQCFGDLVPVSDVIVVTTASSNQFAELQVWLEHIHQFVVPEVKETRGGNNTTQVVVVDAGMHSEQRDVLRQKYHSQFITFPYWSFPDHVNMVGNCSARTPIIIRALLPRVRHSLIYTDPNVELSKDHIRHMLHRVESTGVLFAQPLPIALPVHTAKETFDFFSSDPCAFYPFPEIQSNFGIFRNTSYVSRVLVEPWTSCALTRECVCPVMSDTPCPDDSKSDRVGQCHKFDQSVLNILLAKIFRYNIYRVTLDKNEDYVKTLTEIT